MSKPKDHKQHLDIELGLMKQQVEQLEQELQMQKEMALAAGIFQTDVTVRTLLESLAEGVIICDQAGRVILINKRAEELFGYRPDEVIGRLLNIFMPDRFFSNHVKHIQDFFKNPRIRSMGQNLDLMAKKKDGSEFPVEVSLSHLNTEVGHLGLAFITDISGRKQAEWDLKVRNEELDAFAHTVAHNLKGSLAVLIGYSEVLADTHMDLTESEKHEYITALARNGRQMSNIIDELLVFASVRKEDVVHRPLQMDVIINNTLQRLNFMKKEHNAEFIIANSFPTALGYGSWVEEIWYNYITNAIKYGGRPPVVEIGSEIAGEYVKFWVKDNGQGMTPEDQQQLFTQFSRLKTPKIEGHGLGLSIVAKIVEKLNGRVEVESQVGQGSVFSFYLARDNNVSE